ncbi:MAG: hypothetical protein WCJ19_02410, partial [bacterium]
MGGQHQNKKKNGGEQASCPMDLPEVIQPTNRSDGYVLTLNNNPEVKTAYKNLLLRWRECKADKEDKNPINKFYNITFKDDEKGEEGKLNDYYQRSKEFQIFFLKESLSSSKVIETSELYEKIIKPYRDFAEIFLNVSETNKQIFVANDLHLAFYAKTIPLYLAMFHKIDFEKYKKEIKLHETLSQINSRNQKLEIVIPYDVSNGLLRTKVDKAIVFFMALSLRVQNTDNRPIDESIPTNIKMLIGQAHYDKRGHRSRDEKTDFETEDEKYKILNYPDSIKVSDFSKNLDDDDRSYKTNPYELLDKYKEISEKIPTGSYKLSFTGKDNYDYILVRFNDGRVQLTDAKGNIIFINVDPNKKDRPEYWDNYFLNNILKEVAEGLNETKTYTQYVNFFMTITGNVLQNKGYHPFLANNNKIKIEEDGDDVTVIITIESKNKIPSEVKFIRKNGVEKFDITGLNETPYEETVLEAGRLLLEFQKKIFEKRNKEIIANLIVDIPLDGSFLYHDTESDIILTFNNNVVTFLTKEKKTIVLDSIKQIEILTIIAELLNKQEENSSKNSKSILEEKIKEILQSSRSSSGQNTVIPVELYETRELYSFSSKRNVYGPKSEYEELKIQYDNLGEKFNQPKSILFNVSYENEVLKIKTNDLIDLNILFHLPDHLQSYIEELHDSANKPVIKLSTPVVEPSIASIKTYIDIPEAKELIQAITTLVPQGADSEKEKNNKERQDLLDKIHFFGKIQIVHKSNVYTLELSEQAGRKTCIVNNNSVLSHEEEKAILSGVYEEFKEIQGSIKSIVSAGEEEKSVWEKQKISIGEYENGTKLKLSEIEFSQDGNKKSTTLNINQISSDSSFSMFTVKISLENNKHTFSFTNVGENSLTLLELRQINTYINQLIQNVDTGVLERLSNVSTVPLLSDAPLSTNTSTLTQLSPTGSAPVETSIVSKLKAEHEKEEQRRRINEWALRTPGFGLREVPKNLFLFMGIKIKDQYQSLVLQPSINGKNKIVSGQKVVATINSLTGEITTIKGYENIDKAILQERILSAFKTHVSETEFSNEAKYYTTIRHIKISGSIERGVLTKKKNNSEGLKRFGLADNCLFVRYEDYGNSNAPLGFRLREKNGLKNLVAGYIHPNGAITFETISIDFNNDKTAEKQAVILSLLHHYILSEYNDFIKEKIGQAGIPPNDLVDTSKVISLRSTEIEELLGTNSKSDDGWTYALLEDFPACNPENVGFLSMFLKSTAKTMKLENKAPSLDRIQIDNGFELGRKCEESRNRLMAMFDSLTEEDEMPLMSFDTFSLPYRLAVLGFVNLIREQLGIEEKDFDLWAYNVIKSVSKVKINPNNEKQDLEKTLSTIKTASTEYLGEVNKMFNNNQQQGKEQTS